MGMRARSAFLPIGAGMVLAVAGILLGTTAGVAILAVGLGLALTGMAIGFGAVVSGANVRKKFLDYLDGVLAKVM
jgi:hypothetical protein